jgi:8-oxo-dGTP pyrophosphatase MutT (NUDIX family)
MNRILSAADDWEGRIALALSVAPRPIPVDPRLMPRRGAGPQLPAVDRATFPPARPAATLLLVYPLGGELVIPLTVRRDDLPDHPGEISLPGGAVDPADVDLEATALREAAEEVGLTGDGVRVAGRLDPVWIPVSNFELVPVVATLADPPALAPHEAEVERLIEFPLARLLDTDGITEEDIDIRGYVLRAGVYRWGDTRVWGATARTLAMLGTVLSQIG